MPKLRVVPLKQFCLQRPLPAGPRTDFIYDGRNAWFGSHDTSDELVVTTKELTLWKRSIKSPPMEFDSPKVELPAPLLISHLQKAVRRGRIESALKTLYSLARCDPTKLLRRLPIIMIEDVDLVEGICPIIWLMVANTNHRLTESDYQNLSDFIGLLCHTKHVFRPPKGEIESLTHQEILQLGHPNDNELLCLYYRRKYGGMKGDMSLLAKANHYYCCHIRTLPSLVNSQIVLSHLDPYGVDFIPQGIDFHPYPWLIKRIQSELPGTSQEKIRTLIWTVESGLNIRKPWTIASSSQNEQDPLWEAIACILRKTRQGILQRLSEI